jgi:Tfp pilus assembly PilM family ATPase
MRRLLALERTATEALVIVASTRGGRPFIEQALRLDLGGSQTGAAASEEASSRIASALAERGLQRMDALVAIGRSSVELRQLTLPPSPDDELPDMVRFQALREFNRLEEDWPLDYLPLTDDPDQERRVLAAAVEPKIVDEIRNLCEAARLKPIRLIMRPCAAVSLAIRRLSEQTAPWLLLDVRGEEADLAVAVGEKLVLIRQTRLPGDPLSEPSAAAALTAEVRRTLAAARNQLESGQVESLVLCGADASHAALAKSLGDQLAVEATALDPFDGLALDQELAEAMPEQASHFAPLLGASLDELSEKAPALDFVNPRRRPEPPSRRNTYALAALAAAFVVLAVISITAVRSNQLKNEIRRLQNDANALENRLEQLAQAEVDAKEVQEWLSGEINWLEELRWLSERFSSAQDAMLTQMKLSVNSGRGEMTLDGLARDIESVSRLDEGLHDENHRVAGKSKGESRSNERYRVQFRSSVLIDAKER